MTEYPASLQWAVREAALMDDPHFKRRLAEHRCAPLRLLDYMNRSLAADDELRLYRASEGYTKTASLGHMGFVAHEGAA